MSAWGWMARRVRVLFGKRSAERELDEEMQFHLEMEIRQHVDVGVEPREARRRALVAFGGVERFKEEVRDVRGASATPSSVTESRIVCAPRSYHRTSSRRSECPHYSVEISHETMEPRAPSQS